MCKKKIVVLEVSLQAGSFPIVFRRDVRRILFVRKMLSAVMLSLCVVG